MGLIAHWPLYENSGSTAEDVTGNGNDSTVNGGITQGATGVLGTTCYSFDGTDSYVGVSDSTELQLSGNISVSAWFKADNTSHRGGIVNRWVSANTGYWLLINYNSGYVRGQIGDGSSAYYVRTTFTSGIWNQVVLTNDGSNNRLYLNGLLVDSASAPNPATGSGELEIGSDRGTSNFYQGDVADVRVYDHALSPHEVAYLYEVATNPQVRGGVRRV